MVKVQEAENQIITDYEVYAQRPCDSDLLIPAIDTHRALLGRVPRLVAADAAEFETNLRKERQMEGIAKAKAEGVYKGKGRPKSVDIGTVAALKAQGMGATDIAKELGIGRASVYRALDQIELETGEQGAA
jgi:hypothetical protein